MLETTLSALSLVVLTALPVLANSASKSVARAVEITTTGRTLVDYSILKNKTLANYLTRGVHLARGPRGINRFWDSNSATPSTNAS